MKKNHPHEINARLVISFLIISIACSELILFNTYKEDIANSGSMQLFIILVILGMGLLFSLLHLINPHRK